MASPIVAAFDFDGTLTYKDTLIPFLSYVKGTPSVYFQLFLQLPHFIGFLFGRRSRQKIKEDLLNACLGNMSESDVRSKGSEFALGPLQKYIRAEGLDCVRWHLKNGHHCILISANLDIYLEPWAKNIGFHKAITSRCEIATSGSMTGRLIGLNCRGMEKTRRLTEILGPRDLYTLYAYGDSAGDRELLAMADYAFYRNFPRRDETT